MVFRRKAGPLAPRGGYGKCERPLSDVPELLRRHGRHGQLPGLPSSHKARVSKIEISLIFPSRMPRRWPDIPINGKIYYEKEGLVSKNNLKMGVPRLGTIYDENPDTPEARATIELAEHGIKISITWSRDGIDFYARWFRPKDSIFTPLTESAGPDYLYKMPSKLNFHDSAGAVQLIGCRSVRWRQNVDGFGEGIAFARYAILDAYGEDDYQKVHVLKSEVAGLRSWVGISSLDVKVELETNFPYTPQSAVVKLDSPDPIWIPRRKHLQLVPGWTMGEDGDVRRLEDHLHIQTRYEAPLSWDGHLADHGKIRDLLNISIWENHDLKVSDVQHMDYDEFDGHGGTQVLRKKVCSGDLAPAVKEKWWRHLIGYSDIGPGGISRWIDLSEEFGRAINPALTMLRLKAADSEVQISQIGVCLEALGYLIFMRDDGLTEDKARNKSYRLRFERIAKDIEAVAPFDLEDWVTGTVEAYNGVKHANRVLPDFLEIMNRSRESCLAFRIWIALRLGVDADELKKRVNLDPQSRPYELAT